MNEAMWVLVGGTLGWAAFEYLNARMRGGLAISVIIGAVGGFCGGNVVAPILGAVRDDPNLFNPFSIVVAVGSAAVFLAIGIFLSRRIRV